MAPDAREPCMTIVDPLAALPTPALLLDERLMLANITRLRERAAGLGVRLRPHLKTAKSVDVARRLLDGVAGAATVSTLREAEVFFQARVRDILYARGHTATANAPARRIAARWSPIGEIICVVRIALAPNTPRPRSASASSF